MHDKHSVFGVQCRPVHGSWIIHRASLACSNIFGTTLVPYGPTYMYIALTHEGNKLTHEGNKLTHFTRSQCSNTRETCSLFPEPLKYDMTTTRPFSLRTIKVLLGGKNVLGNFGIILAKHLCVSGQHLKLYVGRTLSVPFSLVIGFTSTNHL